MKETSIQQNVSTLQKGLLPIFSNDRMSKVDSLFMEDRAPYHTAPYHTSQVMQDWFKQNGINKLPWQSQSPDMNTIEHLWGILNQNLRKKNRKPSSKADLLGLLGQTWEEILQDS